MKFQEGEGAVQEKGKKGEENQGENQRFLETWKVGFFFVILENCTKYPRQRQQRVAVGNFKNKRERNVREEERRRKVKAFHENSRKRNFRSFYVINKIIGRKFH